MGDFTGFTTGNKRLNLSCRAGDLNFLLSPPVGADKHPKLTPVRNA